MLEGHKMTYFFYIILFLIISLIIYDKYIQRKHQLLINYPLIGRLRYFFEALREPFRQYFGDEDFYKSKDKIDWIYNAASGKDGYISFAPSQPHPNPKFIIKHANAPLNDEEVSSEFSVTFGEHRKQPFVAKSIVGRSAMSDGSISPEGTKSFAKGAYLGNFPINTGEGSLTTNFFMTHKALHADCMDIVQIKGTNKKIYNFLKKVANNNMAIGYLKYKYIDKKQEDTYAFDGDSVRFFRPNWNAPLESFPKEVPNDLPDIIFQMS
jgi:hypothetical protein